MTKDSIKLGLRIANGESIGALINENNAEITMNIAKKIHSFDMIIKQLDRKNCKLSIAKRYELIINHFSSYGFNNLLVVSDSLGNKLVNPSGNEIVNYFASRIIYVSGFNNFIDYLNQSGVQIDDIINYLIANDHDLDKLVEMSNIQFYTSTDEKEMYESWGMTEATQMLVKRYATREEV